MPSYFHSAYNRTKARQQNTRQHSLNPSALTLITPPCTDGKGHHLVRRCFSQKRIEIGYGHA